jgi:hypothetical protein
MLAALELEILELHGQFSLRRSLEQAAKIDEIKRERCTIESQGSSAVKTALFYDFFLPSLREVEWSERRQLPPPQKARERGWLRWHSALRLDEGTTAIWREFGAVRLGLNGFP